MAYFNYFIKCLIRKFVNILFSRRKMKKLFIISLFFCVIIVLLHNKGYCEFNYTDSNNLSSCSNRLYSIDNRLSGIATSVTSISGQLSTISNNVSSSNRTLTNIENNTSNLKNDLSSLKNELEEVNSVLSNISDNTSSLISFSQEISNKIDTLNNSINNIYSTLNIINNNINANHQELIELLKNQNDLLIDMINGSSEDLGDYRPDVIKLLSNSILSSTSINYHSSSSLRYISLISDDNYTYTYTLTFQNNTNKDFYVSVAFTNDEPSVGVSTFSYQTIKLISGSSYTFTLPNTKKYNYLVFNYYNYVIKYSYDKGNVGINGTIENSAEKIDSTLKNDNIEDTSINMVEDTSKNPTDTGFDNIFNIVYNAFCNNSSVPLNITIPYINETFIIYPNMLSSSLKKDSRLNSLLLFIQSFWWFKISFYIFKDINNYVEQFKNGNITSDDGNIKTEVL